MSLLSGVIVGSVSHVLIPPLLIFGVAAGFCPAGAGWGLMQPLRQPRVDRLPALVPLAHQAGLAACPRGTFAEILWSALGWTMIITNLWSCR